MSSPQVKKDVQLYPVDILNIFENMAQRVWNIGVKGGLPCSKLPQDGRPMGLIVFFTSKAVATAIDTIMERNTHIGLTDIGLKAFGIPIMLKAHDSPDNTFVGTVHMERPEPDAPFAKKEQKQFFYPNFESIAQYKNHVTRASSIDESVSAVMSRLA